MLISIIIPTCNRINLLAECLVRLSPEIQNVNPDIYEIWVTDDSKDDSSELLIRENYKWVKYINGPKKGPSANRNNGAKQAKGDWLIFIDDDCLPDANLINTYSEAIILNKNILVFEGCIKTDRDQRSFTEGSPVNELGGYLWACNFMINRFFFLNTLKGFDQNFPHAAMEDVDLNYRISKLKIPVLFLKESFVVHPFRMQEKMHSITRKRFESTLYFVQKHPEKRKEINAKYFFRLFLLDIKSLLRNSFKYNFRGITGKFIESSLHLYFSFYLIFYKKTKSLHNS